MYDQGGPACLLQTHLPSTIIAAYGNHNKDEQGLAEEMSNTHLVCRGNILLVDRVSNTATQKPASMYFNVR